MKNVRKCGTSHQPRSASSHFIQRTEGGSSSLSIASWCWRASVHDMAMPTRACTLPSVAATRSLRQSAGVVMLTGSSSGSSMHASASLCSCVTSSTMALPSAPFCVCASASDRVPAAPPSAGAQLAMATLAAMSCTLAVLGSTNTWLSRW